MAKVAVKRDILELNRQRMILEHEEREKERAMRREEREASQKLGLDNFKLILEVLKSNK